MLKASAISVNASADARVLVVQLQGPGGHFAGLQLFEQEGTSPYEPRGFVRLERNGSLFLSPDGRFALLHVLQESERFNQPTRQLIIEFDLTRPTEPIEKNRIEVSARKVAVARDAGAYAVSEPAVQERRWQTRIYTKGNTENSVVVEETEYARLRSISPGGRFVLYSDERNLELIDLAGSPPVRYAQPNVWTPRFSCVLTLLESGHVLLEDARTSRFGVYAPKPGVPRVGRLDHSGSTHCLWSLANTSAKEVLVAGDYGALRRIDLREAAKPAITGAWRLLPGITPLAVAQGLLFAAAGERGEELHWFSLASISKHPVDWRKIETEHRLIMAKYREDMTRGKPYPEIDAMRRLQALGILTAVDAPVTGIPAKRAAAILYDYAVFLPRTGYHGTVAEQILKRAIDLDPRRATPYLTLADLQRESLPDFAHWTQKSARMREAIANYNKYVALGGQKTASITSFVRGGPLDPDRGDVCDGIARYANAGRLRELVSYAGLEIPSAVGKIDIFSTRQGTAHVPSIHAFDSATDRFLADKEAPARALDDPSLWVDDDLGLLVYRNHIHILHFRDFSHPVASVSLADGSTCRLVAQFTERIGPKAREPALCKRLQADQGMDLLRFDGPVGMTPEQVRSRYRQSRAVGTLRADFTNDGKLHSVVQIDLSSTAGPGCDATSYHLVDHDATRFESGPVSDLLMKLQESGPSSAGNRLKSCKNKPVFFRFQGKIYYEKKPVDWPPKDAGYQYHRVGRIENGRVTDVCDFTFKSHISVKR